MSKLTKNKKKNEKLERIKLYIEHNGVYWTSFYILAALCKYLLNVLNKVMERLEKKYNLSGSHGTAINYAVWQHYNWEKKGEEWGLSSEWKQSLINEVMLKYIMPGKVVLEIGPGAGKWTEALQKISERLILVDLSDKCIELCKKRFSYCDNIEFFVNNGVNLDFIPNESVDFIWSFDVFVHIRPQETEKYLEGVKRILKKGGRTIIHHAKEGKGLYGGWRSNMTAELFSSMLKNQGFSLITQFDSWGNNGEFNVHSHHDIITVFEK